jgi:hypothetical protein
VLEHYKLATNKWQAVAYFCFIFTRRFGAVYYFILCNFQTLKGFASHIEFVSCFPVPFFCDLRGHGIFVLLCHIPTLGEQLLRTCYDSIFCTYLHLPWRRSAEVALYPRVAVFVMLLLREISESIFSPCLSEIRFWN